MADHERSVRRFVVGECHVFCVAGFGIGESVHGSTIGVQLPVDLGAAHLLLEGRDLGWWHQGIGRAMAYEHLGLDVGRIGGSWTCENAMEAHDGGERCAAARQLERRAATETIAERRQPGAIDAFLS